MSRRCCVLAVLVAGALVLAGCTGVPTGSAPETVRPVGVGQQSNGVPPPPPGAPARLILQKFLEANTSDPLKHSTAREYLTPAARNRWSATTVTVIADERVDIYDSTRRTIGVSGRKVGTVDSHGVYTPTLDGVGHGGAKVEFVFGIDQVRGQNRISTLSNGLLLTEDQFVKNYAQRPLYFFDSSDTYLVPDVRYSALTDPGQLADWMLDQLAQGPAPDLASVVNTNTLPTNTGPAQAQRISVRITAAAVTVQIPGSRQLSADVRNRLAAQIGFTLNRAVNVGEMTMVDGNRPVQVPRVNGTKFSAGDFAAEAGPPLPTPAVFYVCNGRVCTANGHTLRGPLGTGSVLLDSVALTRSSTDGELLVAGVQGTGNQQRLLVGTQNDGLRATTLPAGSLTRPAWAPGRSEVWVGAGPVLYRITTNGRASQVTRVQIPAVAGGGRFVAVRISPDGSRVALVVSGANGKPQLFVGGVVRNGSTVQVEGAPTQISPDGVIVRDVAWIDPVKLYAIGYLASSGDAQVFKTNVDGSDWDNLGTSSLPKPPDSITTATDSAPWVSAEGFVWEQNGGNWVSPVISEGQTRGDNPIYLG